MRVRRSPGATGVGRGARRDVEIKVSFSPAEYAVVAGVARSQGWEVGGWAAAITECVERLGNGPQGGGLGGVEWGRVQERAGSIEACAQCLGDAADAEVCRRLEQEAGQLALMGRAQVMLVRQRGSLANLDAARIGETAAQLIGPGARAGRGPGQRRRVKVLLTENTAGVARATAATGGWATADWVGAVVAGAAGWLAVYRPDRVAQEVAPWALKLEVVRQVLIAAQWGPHRGDLDRQTGTELAGWAILRTATAARGLALVAAAQRADHGSGQAPTFDSAAMDAMCTRVGWSGPQLHLDVRPSVQAGLQQVLGGTR